MARAASRTAALGGQQLACDGCGATQWRWHLCRNRHCRQCQSRARDAWRSARLAELLNVPYSHLVFTLPHELNAPAVLHPRWVYTTLVQRTAATLSQFAANPRCLGGTGAFTLVLHSRTQDLRRHLHVHALMACGALQCDTEGNTRWVRPRRAPNFLFPVKALANVFRGKFLQAIVQAEQSGELPRDPAQTHDSCACAPTTQAASAWCASLGTSSLADCCNTCYPQGSNAIVTMGCWHRRPKRERMSQVRVLLEMPQTQPQAIEDAQAFMHRVASLEINTCPRCRNGRLRLVQLLAPQRSTTSGLIWAAACRRPP